MAWRRIDTNKNVYPCAALALLSLLAYGDSLLNGFVMDDQYILLRNFTVRHLGSLPLLVSPRYFELFAEQSWRPVVSLSYILDYQIWRLAPMGYHFHNLVLHAVNAILVYLILKKITGQGLPAFITAGLFAAHTISGEAVNVVSFREDLQVVFFMLLALWALLKIYDGGKKAWIALLWACAFLAIPAKENGAALPLLLAGAGYAIGGRRFFVERRGIWLGVVAAFAASLSIRFFILTPPSNLAAVPASLTILEKILMIIKIQGYYLLSLFYIVPFLPNMTVTNGLAVSLVVIGNLLLWVIFLRDKRAKAALLFYAVAMMPVANIVPLANPIAFRYLYFPALGLYYLSGLTIHKLFERGYLAQRALIGFLFLILFGSTLYSAVWSRIWRDDLSLAIYAARYNPQDSRTWANLASAQNNRGLYAAAEESARRALRLNPDDFYSRSALAMSHLKRGKFEEALDYYRSALRFPSVLNSRAEIYFGMAYAMASLNRAGEAIEMYQRTLEINPCHTGALSNLAVIYCEQGNLKKAEPLFTQVLNLDPHDAQTHFNMALLLFQTERSEKAIPHLRRALQLDPQNARAAQMLRHIEQK
ncbi:MAG TPA: tetratricopeptide repeat protein [Candidatus Sumerlaeota bacterium]|nr:MAG: photosystem I assembly protein Ycf3 [candidate division BRC1 bacterium ADurb.Bin183]HOE62808.1 tetratricopeptide repeat protein [Candidatus Sumerlaeota bacterium]HRR32303.1 tetratricopeptide repeat protein [Candidatus Sumerlaeia bacterium]HON50333.1 tetratricopeptide repeat protein [Candidatus Sumerlaeota bacterium]HOR63549.1 tetratricopeptide repeat protein [Candidatus Sumerlaeota bacterium]